MTVGKRVDRGGTGRVPARAGEPSPLRFRLDPGSDVPTYRELEHRGIVEGRPGQGTFVRSVPALTTLRELAGLRRALLGWIAQAADRGLDDEAMAALFASSLRDYRERGSRGVA
jgi:GntR family transcriptional regulator